MSNSYFRFKQFTVRQENAAMKVGTDGVILGAWANVSGAKTILDIGTGSGLIALMLAQRSNANIDAVEIDEPSYKQALENVGKSPWKDRIFLHHKSFQAYAKQANTVYDLIVSNPPYFIKSLQPSEAARTAARHANELPHNELIEGVIKFLPNNGCFAAIFPYVEGNIFVALAAKSGLFCCKRVNVYGKKGSNIKRLLLEFRKDKFSLVESDLSIRDIEDGFTDEYRFLTKDFYLAF